MTVTLEALIAVMTLLTVCVPAAVVYGRRIERDSKISEDQKLTNKALQQLEKAVCQMRETLDELHIEQRLERYERWGWDLVELEHWVRNHLSNLASYLPTDIQDRYRTGLVSTIEKARQSAHKQRRNDSLYAAPPHADKSLETHAHRNQTT